MREIKFRALYEGVMVHNAARVGNALYWDNGKNFDLTAFKQENPAILMQLVGHDINGRDVYEADTVRIETFPIDDSAFGYYGKVTIVEYIESAMRYMLKTGDHTYVFYDLSTCEIIGNIYEDKKYMQFAAR